MRIALAAIAVAVTVTGARWAQAQTIPLLTFESDEFSSDPSASLPVGGANSTTGLNGAGFGITEGTRAFVMTGVNAVNDRNFFSTTISGSSTGESLNNYNAFLSAYNQILAGKDVFLDFDFGYNIANITTTGFFQPGIFVNSDQGFSERRFGNLLQGNLGPGGNFPTLNAAAAPGATLTILDPVGAGGDTLGLARVRIPIGTAGDLGVINIGPGGDTTNNFFAIGLHEQGGYVGTADFSFDNIVFEVVPEPASAAVLGVGCLAGLVGRRRRNIA